MFKVLVVDDDADACLIGLFEPHAVLVEYRRDHLFGLTIAPCRLGSRHND